MAPFWMGTSSGPGTGSLRRAGFGGGRVSDEEILRRTVALIGQGVSGIVYGRNIIQHPNPVGITRALMAVVHDGATAEEAATLIRS